LWVRVSPVGQDETMARKVLIGCGILSSLLYVVANVVGSRRWKGYSLSSHTVSELSAIGAPSRPLVVPLLAAHGALVVPFGVGLGASDLPAPFFPIHRREALAGDERSRTDTMHIAVTSVNSLLILLAIGFGSTAFGKRFRLYSIGTILVLVVTGALTATQASRVEANLPTPGAGATERISIGGYLAWQVVLAIALLRAQQHGRLRWHA
jgi:hypothetical protein